jgi:hypothetical protein
MTMFLSGISASSSSADGGGRKIVSDLTDFFVHGLRRGGATSTSTDDGMLWYTKVRSTDSAEVGDFYRTDGTQYPGFLDGVDYVDETTENKSYKNHPADKYQQYRFDFRNLTYFIDDDGYLVARLGSNYDHNTAGPK